jgi:KDO2-lipid IV(A) lauroyltransferase
MRRLTDWLVYFLIRVFICVVQSLSMETCAAVSRFLAFLACDVIRIRAAVVDDNLRQVYTDMSVEERRKLVRHMWQHLFLMVCEVAHIRRKVNESNYQDYVKFHNKKLLVRYLLDPRPKVLVTGHFGNFEVAGYVLGLFGFPSFTIARALIVPKDGCSQQVDAILRAGGTLSLLGDQHAGANGCWVDFLGRPASCHKAVALFTLTTGAPQLVCYLRRLNEPMKFEVGVVDVADPL